ncbi:uncharacterized protein LOC126738179 isoform X2 [Anthonomus grandis grandis]|uniref:uncharacterized protein LOC126738179 isoform X2 n=1 Tax=Anthonomus grandis grandis TaxID=2921223 RepID=UPI0021655362|nr:uncharacterized protein LOC126738179 isoform X2 [Anthonomus grandis grandis]
MKTILLTLSVFIILGHAAKQPQERARRGSISSSYSLTDATLNLPTAGSSLYSLGIDSFLPFPEGQLPVSKLNIAPVALSNSIEKPVQEASDPMPQQPTGTAVIPFLPPPAVPVNAAAANVPSNNGAVFLGSGALGVVHLGNGAFALGSGGIGYSDQRQQPRPNGRSPLYPPLAASPNLVPAATPSQQPAPIPRADLSGQLSPNGYGFQQPLFSPSISQPQVAWDQNGYERLAQSGFGSPSNRIRPLKTRMNYATATQNELRVEAGHISQLPQPGFGTPIPRLPAQSVTYL